jgi:starch phosphorylase
MVADYTRRFYEPSAAKWRYLTAEACARARAFSNWKNGVRQAWPEITVKDVIIEAPNGDGCHQLSHAGPQLTVGSELCIRALVKLGSIDQNDVAVEFYHGPVDTWQNIKSGSAVQMEYDHPAEQPGEHWFVGSMPCTQTGKHGVSVRVLPKHEDLVDPYDMGLIIWDTAG